MILKNKIQNYGLPRLHQYPKSQPLIGWDFFARSPSVGAVSGPCLASAAPAKSAFLPPTDASLFSVFSGGHAIVPKVISFANAGLEAVVCG